MMDFLKSFFLTRRAGNVANGKIIKGNGKIVGEERTTLNRAQFDKIVVSGAADVHICQAAECSVIVVGDDNIVPLILTDVCDNTLHISSRGSYYSKSTIRVSITLPNIEKITVSGSSDVVVFNIKQDKAVLKVSGSGDITATGQVAHLTLEASGSGGIRAILLNSDIVDAKCSGSGDISATATKSATLKANGSGDIKIYGKPTTVTSTSKGSGDILIL